MCWQIKNAKISTGEAQLGTQGLRMLGGAVNRSGQKVFYLLFAL